MKRNLPEIIEKAATFLDPEMKLTDNQIEKMCDYLKFEKMQKNPAVNLEPVIGAQDASSVKFIRKGEIGDWKNYMDETVSKKFDDWIEQKFYGTGLEFEYE